MDISKGERMSKYVFTDKMPIFGGKQLTKIMGCEDYYQAFIFINEHNLEFGCHSPSIPELIERGLISEVKEPIWTDDDILDFLKYCGYTIDFFNDLMDDFKKERGIE